MSMEGGRNNRGRDMSGSYTYVSKCAAKDKRIKLYGVFEREKQFDDIPKIWEYEICIQKQRILVQRILCRYSRKNTKAIKEYISEQLKRDRESDQLSLFDPRDPFMGSK